LRMSCTYVPVYLARAGDFGNNKAKYYAIPVKKCSVSGT
jgi:hypothetical protein